MQKLFLLLLITISLVSCRDNGGTTHNDVVNPELYLSGGKVIVEYPNGYVEPGFKVVDDRDNDITDNVKIETDFNPSVLGLYHISYSVEDSSGNKITRTREIELIDVNEPIINLIGGDLILEVNSVYNEPGYAAIDDYDGQVTANVTVNSNVDMSSLGVYYLHYNVQDSSGNQASQKMRKVTVVDTTPPVINLLGNNPTTIELGTLYTEPGATASDNYDGDVSDDIVITNNIDLLSVGDYQITYNVEDDQGNDAIERVRTLQIRDTTPPSVNLAQEGVVYELEYGAQYQEPGVTYSDLGGISSVSTKMYFNNIEVQDFDALGSYVIKYVITDNSNNETSKERIISYKDTTAPLILLIGDNPIEVEKNTQFTDPGVTVSDEYDDDKNNTIIVVMSSLDTTTVGRKIIFYSAEDSNGNISYLTRVANIVEPPSLENMRVVTQWENGAINNKTYIIDKDEEDFSNKELIFEGPILEGFFQELNANNKGIKQVNYEDDIWFSTTIFSKGDILINYNRYSKVATPDTNIIIKDSFVLNNEMYILGVETTEIPDIILSKVTSTGHTVVKEFTPSSMDIEFLSHSPVIIRIGNEIWSSDGTELNTNLKFTLSPMVNLETVSVENGKLYYDEMGTISSVDLSEIIITPTPVIAMANLITIENGVLFYDSMTGNIYAYNLDSESSIDLGVSNLESSVISKDNKLFYSATDVLGYRSIYMIDTSITQPIRVLGNPTNPSVPIEYVFEDAIIKDNELFFIVIDKTDVQGTFDKRYVYIYDSESQELDFHGFLSYTPNSFVNDYDGSLNIKYSSNYITTILRYNGFNNFYHQRWAYKDTRCENPLQTYNLNTYVCTDIITWDSGESSSFFNLENPVSGTGSSQSSYLPITSETVFSGDFSIEIKASNIVDSFVGLAGMSSDSSSPYTDIENGFKIQGNTNVVEFNGDWGISNIAMINAGNLYYKISRIGTTVSIYAKASLEVPYILLYNSVEPSVGDKKLILTFDTLGGITDDSYSILSIVNPY